MASGDVANAERLLLDYYAQNKAALRKKWPNWDIPFASDLNLDDWSHLERVIMSTALSNWSDFDAIGQWWKIINLMPTMNKALNTLGLEVKLVTTPGEELADVPKLDEDESDFGI